METRQRQRGLGVWELMRAVAEQFITINAGSLIKNAVQKLLMNINVIAGRNIARIRRDLGLKQEELSVRTGVTQQYISGVEAGQRNVSLFTLEKLAAGLNVEPATLLDREAAESFVTKNRYK